jgi:hypothetical protein
MRLLLSKSCYAPHPLDPPLLKGEGEAGLLLRRDSPRPLGGGGPSEGRLRDEGALILVT